MPRHLGMMNQRSKVFVASELIIRTELHIFFLTTECKFFYLQTTRTVRIFIEFLATTLLKAIFAGLCNRAFSYTIPSSNVCSCLTLSFYAICFYFRKPSCAMQDRVFRFASRIKEASFCIRICY